MSINGNNEIVSALNRRVVSFTFVELIPFTIAKEVFFCFGPTYARLVGMHEDRTRRRIIVAMILMVFVVFMILAISCLSAQICTMQLI